MGAMQELSDDAWVASQPHRSSDAGSAVRARSSDGAPTRQVGSAALGCASALPTWCSARHTIRDDARCPGRSLSTAHGLGLPAPTPQGAQGAHILDEERC